MEKKFISCRESRQLSVYIHIPFCIRKCFYCDFDSHEGTNLEIEMYVKNLCIEIKNESTLYSKYKIHSIYFGGGTPSLLSKQEILLIFKTLKDNYAFGKKVEISLEANPKTVTKEKLIAYKKCGVNRLSIGMQSSKDNELKALGRVHNYADFLETFQLARACGYNNINIDIMAAIPGQTLDSYVETLQTVCALSPEHISSYSLIVEENTPFYSWYKLGKKREDSFEEAVIPSEDLEREMYEETKRTLLANGYRRYEISNYAKEGQECFHNLVYWNRGNYVGFGKSAASCVENIRWTNDKEIKHKLSRKEQMEEFMFLGMRKMEGVFEDDFFSNFQCSIYSIYGKQIQKYIENGLLNVYEVNQKGKNKKAICLTDKGIDVSNIIFADFLLDE